MKVVDPELSAQTGKEEKIVWLIHIYYMIFVFRISDMVSYNKMI